MNKLINFSMLLLPVFLTGCDKDRSLDPPPNAEKIKFIVHISPGVTSLPLGIMYRSEICKKSRSDAKGERYEVPGYNYFELPAKNTERRGELVYNLYLDGGGECQWFLSNFTFKAKLVSELKSVSTDVIFTFHGQKAQVSNGMSEKIVGNKIIRREYFPMLTRKYISGYKEVMSLFYVGENFTYQVSDAKTITLNFILKNKMLIERDAPLKHGGDFIIKYPDGTTSDKDTFPRKEKLESMLQLD